jgi:hypothetical protein
MPVKVMEPTPTSKTSRKTFGMINSTPKTTNQNTSILNTPLNYTYPTGSTISSTQGFTSPIPIPDQNVFNSKITLTSSDKKKPATGTKSSSKYLPPSPPSKSPPMSRLGLNQKNQLYTPSAQPILFDQSGQLETTNVENVLITQPTGFSNGNTELLKGNLMSCSHSY